MSHFAQRILPKPSRSAGFTLIELMIALFVFAIGMLAITAMCMISIKGNYMVNRMTEANFLAQGKMEEMLAEVDMSLLVDGSEVDIDGNGNAGGSYTRSWDVTAVDDNRWIKVRVTWTDSKGSHQVALTSFNRDDSP